MASKKRGKTHTPKQQKKTARGNSVRERSPTVSIVGAGRMGTALALALSRCGYTIEALVTERKSHAVGAARLFPLRPLALSSTEIERLPPSDLLFITTPDDLINEAALRIAAGTKERAAARRTALHMSGALSSEELGSLRERGFHTGSMHPLIAISGAHAGAERLPGAFFCIEGEPKAVAAARRVVRRLGARSFSIGTGEKALYHAAAVMASGHVVALFDIAIEMLARCGLGKREARTILMPLLQSTLDNLSEREPALALTGTFARADARTVRRHLNAILVEGMRDALEAYRLLGRRSLRLAEKAVAKKALAKSDAFEAILKAMAEAAGEE